jgi:hypothetical protein
MWVRVPPRACSRNRIGKFPAASYSAFARRRPSRPEATDASSCSAVRPLMRKRWRIRSSLAPGAREALRPRRPNAHRCVGGPQGPKPLTHRRCSAVRLLRKGWEIHSSLAPGARGTLRSRRRNPRPANSVAGRSRASCAPRHLRILHIAAGPGHSAGRHPWPRFEVSPSPPERLGRDSSTPSIQT